jgi:hypothetical protein
MATIKVFTFAALLLSCATSFADSPADRFSVVAERNLPTGKEQRALVFQGDTVQLVANSNFLDQPSSTARIGVYESSLDTVLKARRDELFHIKQRLDRTGRMSHGSTSEAGSPHGTRYFVAGHELKEGAQFREKIADLLAGAWSLAKWSPKDGALIRRTTGDDATLETSSGTAELKCRPVEFVDVKNVVFCSVPNFGSVYLSKP